jgi:hypothetical protein
MTRHLILGLCAVLVLSACNSRLNPVNWFGTSEPVAAVELAPAPGADPRDLVAEVLEVTIEPMQGGAILTATGRTATQGWWSADLVLREGEGTDPAAPVYDFRVLPPVVPTAVSTPQSREITVGLFLTDDALDGVRSITVQGAGNGRAVRR